ncbi:MAG: methyltransferase type 12 [Acidobacteria bacterium]|nr:methyltransferase type 12 [Acidobacteriota bacterium]
MLSFYDLLVHKVSNRFAWRCPTDLMIDHYEQHLADPHLDVGVGTGFFLDKARFPVPEPRVTLLDPNRHCLDSAARRIARYQPSKVAADALAPLPELGRFGSIGLLYVLHCLPGTMASKAVIFDRLKPLLADGGTLFGATILDDDEDANAVARALMGFYNRKGIFSNREDSQQALELELRRRFERVEISREGCVALFAAS